MQNRISIPVDAPRDGPTVSYWQSPPDHIADLKTTETLPESADIVIIGSGISGSTVAYNLLTARPESKIVMLEARQAASGASGRNGGHTKHASYRTFYENMQTLGIEESMKIAQLEYDCMTAVHQFIRDHQIDCDGLQCDTVDIFYSQAQLDVAHQAVDLIRKHFGEDSPVSQYTFHDPAETARRFLAPDSLGSLQYEAGSLSAYKLTIGILKLALAKGLNLQCNTPAVQIERDPDTSTWTVTTATSGRITTPTLILATNGYTANLHPPLQGVIVPFRGIVTAHRPGTHMPQTGLPTTYSFIYEKGYDYMISRPAGSTHAGDIVIGGGLTKAQGGHDDGMGEYGNTDDTTVDPHVDAYLHDTTRRFFGPANWGDDHPAGRVRHAWSGIMGYSADGHPLVGEVPGEKGLWLDASFQGHGMVMCFLCAEAVAQMVLGRDGEELRRWFPACYRVTQERMRLRFGEQGPGLGLGLGSDGEKKEKKKDVTKNAGKAVEGGEMVNGHS